MFVKVKENQKCPSQDSETLSRVLNFCRDACYSNQPLGEKNRLKKHASQQTFDHFYFIKALESALRIVSVKPS